MDSQGSHSPPSGVAVGQSAAESQSTVGASLQTQPESIHAGIQQVSINDHDHRTFHTIEETRQMDKFRLNRKFKHRLIRGEVSYS